MTSEVEAKAAKVGKSVGGFAGYLARSGLTFQQNEAVSIIAQSFGTTPGGKPLDPAQRVDQHFQALHDFQRRLCERRVERALGIKFHINLKFGREGVSDNEAIDPSGRSFVNV